MLTKKEMMEIKFKRDTAFRKQFFVPDSFAHPAKMDSQLLIWIVEHYTEAGETILDPMAGSGTTMLACTLGRDVILVELEEKFCKMMRDNWYQVQMKPQLGSTMGTCQIILGDARQLEGLVDKIVTSPPYAEGLAGSGKNSVKWWDDKAGGSNFLAKNYGTNPNNIGNLPYGEIDKCIFSPPHGNRLSDAEVKDGDPQRMSYRQILGQIDKIVTSPPYEEAMGQKHHSPVADKVFKEKGLGVYTDRVDSIITSPPYEGTTEAVNKAERSQYQKPDTIMGKRKGTAGGFKASGIQLPEDKNNIGNLKSQSYLEAMLQVYQQCYKVLKPEGSMILVTKNFLRNRQEIRLDIDTIALCEQAGFQFIERHFRVLPSQSFWRIIYAKKYPDAPVIDKEDILVFKKG